MLSLIIFLYLQGGGGISFYPTSWERWKGLGYGADFFAGNGYRCIINYSFQKLTVSEKNNNKLSYLSYLILGSSLYLGKSPFFIGGGILYGNFKNFKINDIQLKGSVSSLGINIGIIAILYEGNTIDIPLFLNYQRFLGFKDFHQIKAGILLTFHPTKKEIKINIRIKPYVLNFSEPAGTLYVIVRNTGMKTLKNAHIVFSGDLLRYVQFKKTVPSFTLDPGSSREFIIPFRIIKDLKSGRTELIIECKGSGYSTRLYIYVRSKSLMDLKGPPEGTP